MATITGTAGANTSNDTVGTSDYYDMLAGGDTVYAGAGNDTLYGGGDSDLLYGGNDNDTIYGDAGTDTLSGDLGNDILFGGTDGSADTLYGGDGDDTLDGGPGPDRLFGGNGNDLIYAGVLAAQDADSLDGGGGQDTVSFAQAGQGVNITLVAGSATFNPTGTANTDTLTGIEHIIGTNFDDTINGDTVANMLYGGANADILSGGDAADSLFGGTEDDDLSGDAGADLLYGGAGADALDGGAGADLLYGDAGADNMVGGTEDDTLYGGDGADSMSGDAGNDIMVGGAGADTLDGGTGTDTADYSGSAAGVNVTINASGNTGGDAAGDTLAGIENLTGSNSADTLVGDGGNNVIDGRDGADTINAGAGSDTVFGGVGADTIDGGAGNDSLSGGNDADSITGGSGADTIDGGSGTDNIDGGIGNDSILGGSESDTITGGFGNDTIDGGTGSDSIVAGPASGGGTGTVALDFNWSAYADETNLAGGVSQDTGGINVNMTLTPGQNFTNFSAETSETIYVAGGETFSTTSSGFLNRSNNGAATQLDVNFSSVSGSGLEDTVSNVTFRISDIDEETWKDRVIIRAYDANGNLIPVTMTESQADMASTSSATGATVTAVEGGANTSPNLVDGSVLVTIPGPVARFEIVYDNIDTSNQFIYVSDIQFTATYSPDNDSVIGGTGNDTILGGIGEDTLLGGADNDLLYGGTGNDSLNGEAGNDTLYGDDGNDTLQGGDLNDVLYGGAGNDSISGDTVGGVAGNDTVFGDGGNDTLTGGDNSDLLYGGTENDVVSGDVGTDTLYGDAGNDTLYGGNDADYTYGGAGNDLIYGGDGNDTILGDTGTDTLRGGAGNDTFQILTGEINAAGNDVIFGGGGVQEGGTGLGQPLATDFDVVDLSGSFLNVDVDVVYLPGFGPGDNGGTNLSGTINVYLPGQVHIMGNLIGQIDFSEIEKVIECFTPGTMIMTDAGEVAVETLRPGAMVLTRDNGFQPLRWAGGRTLSYAELLAKPDLQPIRIAKDALPGVGPDRSMLVSPQHRVLIDGARAEILFGEAEVLVPAKHLVGHVEATRALPAEGVTYIHLLFDQHEAVLSDGIWTESFQPAARTLNAMDEGVREEILALFPELRVDADGYPSARLSLKAHEVRVLLSN